MTLLDFSEILLTGAGVLTAGLILLVVGYIAGGLLGKYLPDFNDDRSEALETYLELYQSACQRADAYRDKHDKIQKRAQELYENNEIDIDQLDHLLYGMPLAKWNPGGGPTVSVPEEDADVS